MFVKDIQVLNMWFMNLSGIIAVVGHHVHRVSIVIIVCELIEWLDALGKFRIHVKSLHTGGPLAHNG